MSAQASNAAAERTDWYSFASPALELIYEASAPALRGQWPLIESGLELVKPMPLVGDWEDAYLTIPAHWSGETDSSANGNGTIHGADPPVPITRTQPLPNGLLQDRPAERIALLDRSGVDAQLIGPGVQMFNAAKLPSNLAAGLFASYNEHMSRYCSADPERLKSIGLLHGSEAEWAAREAGDLAADPAVAGVSIYLPVRVGPDSRDFRPIWQAIQDAGLPVIHRPGLSSQVWTGERLIGYLAASGVLSEFDGLEFVLIGAAPEEVARMAADPAPGAEVARAAFDSGRIRCATRYEDRRDGGLWYSDFPFAELPAEKATEKEVAG